jgi:hypothetical protein
MAEPLVGGIPIVVVSFPGVRGKQRLVAAVPLTETIAEVRKRIPAEPAAIPGAGGKAEPQARRRSPPRLARFLVPANGIRGWRYTGCRGWPPREGPLIIT